MKESVKAIFLKNRQKGPVLRKSIIPELLDVRDITFAESSGSFYTKTDQARLILQFPQALHHIKVIFSIQAKEQGLRAKLSFYQDAACQERIGQITVFVDGTYSGQYLSFSSPVNYMSLDIEHSEVSFQIRHLEIIRVCSWEESLFQLKNRSARIWAITRQNPQLIYKFIHTARHFGIRSAIQKALAKGCNSDSGYLHWIAWYDTISPIDRAQMETCLQAFEYKPLLSIIMPVYNPEPKYFRKAIESVLAQTYPYWELCMAEDQSPNPQIREIIAEYAQKDQRICPVYRQENGHISRASNSALAIAQGEFAVLMDHDDLLPSHALFMVAHEINQRSNEVDLIYSDEDKINANDERYDPYFKSDWNEVLFESQNFVAHLGVYRMEIIKKIGGFRAGFEGSQDYDLALRFLEHTHAERISHIPHVLYHWRIFQGNHTFSTDNHHISDDSAYKALTEAFERRHKQVTIDPVESFPGCWHISGEITKPLPLVSIIIPTRDRVEILKNCVEGLLKRTQYEAIEIIIVDNDSQKVETKRYFEALQQEVNVTILAVPGPFNYSRLNNEAVKAAKGKYICLLNNDIEIIHDTWLQELVYQAEKDNVGAVGAKLYYGNNTLQHGGVVLGIYGVASHNCRHQPRQSVGYFGQLQLARSVSAVTGACLLTTRDIYEKVGGLDEQELAVSYNDVDFCLKVRQSGYEVVYTPFAQLYHLESVSRGQDVTKEQKERYCRERNVMVRRYGELLQHDPFYSPNLSLENENMTLAFPPRTTKPWRNWFEFVCPFHRGDVILGIQIAQQATRMGRKLRFHVAETLISWVQDFVTDYDVEPVAVPVPPAAETYPKYREACNLVTQREDASRYIVGSHPSNNFNEIGLNIVENMFCSLEVPIDTVITPLLPVYEEAAYQQAEVHLQKYQKPVVLLHPYGGWKLKSLPAELIEALIKSLQQAGYAVVQIGGKSDLVISACDGHILENYSPKQWRPIFEKSLALCGIDSWSSHFAAIVDCNQIAFYGSTRDCDVSSRHFFACKKSRSLIFATKAECAPCHSLTCKYKTEDCRGYHYDENKLLQFLQLCSNS